MKELNSSEIRNILKYPVTNLERVQWPLCELCTAPYREAVDITF